MSIYSLASAGRLNLDMNIDFDPLHQTQHNQQDSQQPQQPGGNLAPQACTPCRKQKRKCDKQLPTCSLCQRIGRPCDYRPDTQLPAPSPEDFAALQQQVSNLEQLLRNGAGRSVTPAQSNGHNSSNGSLSLSNGSSPPKNDNSNPLSPFTSRVFSPPTSFPSLYFLDSNAFVYERYQVRRQSATTNHVIAQSRHTDHTQIPSPYVRVPPGALTALGNSQDLRGMIEHYFSTVHTYLPVVSKIRLYQHLSNPAHEPGSDIALLFLAMKLACNELPEGMPAQTQLYSDVKSFYHFVESQNGFTIQMIQALLLISMYEMGHSIYPAAYLSIGNAARIGYAMGLHHAKDTPQMLPRPTTWTEQEERRRVWWGIILLDRYINLGHRGKPFATNDPGLETHLPTDDESWDRGQMLVAAPLALSASQTIQAAPFARTCQASHLMGKVIRHIDDKSLPCEYRFPEALQLTRTMRALADVIPHDVDEQDPSMQPPLCTAAAICYSSLLTLYDAYSCTGRRDEDLSEDQLIVQKESIDGLRDYSERVLVMARRVRAIIERHGPSGLSPMIIDSVYQGAANCESPQINIPDRGSTFANHTHLSSRLVL